MTSLYTIPAFRFDFRDKIPDASAIKFEKPFFLPKTKRALFICAFSLFPPNLGSTADMYK